MNATITDLDGVSDMLDSFLVAMWIFNVTLHRISVHAVLIKNVGRIIFSLTPILCLHKFLR